MSAMQQIWSRVQLLFGQGRVARVGARDVQVRVLDEEVLEAARVQPYGFSHRPLGGEAYLGFVAGDRALGIALIVGDRRYEMDLSAGEVAIHDHQGNFVHIQAGGVIEVCASTKVVATTPLLETTGDVHIGGNLVVAGSTQAAGFYGPSGAAASLAGGAQVEGTFVVNGKDVSDGHVHISSAPGTPTSGVV